MAEGGRDIDYEDKAKAPDSKDDDENTNLIDFNADTTGAFEPGSASSPYHRGERHEMQTILHEHGPPSYLEAPLLGEMIPEEEKEGLLERARNFIRARFPRVDFRKLGPIGFSKKSTGEIVSFGRQGGETRIFKKDDSGLLKAFTDKFSTSLGPSAEEIIAEDRDTIQEQRQRAADADEQLKQANALAAEREKEEQEIENLRQKIERTQAQIDARGSNLENEMKLKFNRLKQLKKNHQAELEEKKKELKNKQKTKKRHKQTLTEKD